MTALTKWPQTQTYSNLNYGYPEWEALEITNNQNQNCNVPCQERLQGNTTCSTILSLYFSHKVVKHHEKDHEDLDRSHWLGH